MVTRRDFLGGIGLGLGAGLGGLMPLRAWAQGEGRKRLAVVTTFWNEGSHAWHMAERFLVGYPTQGGWHKPGLEVVSAYVDQSPEGDLSKGRAAEVGRFFWRGRSEMELGEGRAARKGRQSAAGGLIAAIRRGTSPAAEQIKGIFAGQGASCV